jgi:ribosomal protein S14
MFSRQGGLCAICGKPETTKRKGVTFQLAIDHCHDTGRVRGLICRRCNSGLGYFYDDPMLLQRALGYLGE